MSDGDVPLCPPWWPQIVWDLHFHPRPSGHPWPGPVNYPPAIDDMMAALHIHTMSYLLRDQERAQGIRAQAEQTMAETASKLSELHESRG
ncbi:hypothetical protein [Kitasatospora sp. NPDC057015]|uniref:hypothetical protein n=1 Tax=Kitasatospora sp. NPDC057015 TaxID=3346001 RepID=UPI0036365707